MNKIYVTSNDQGGCADRDNSANWLRSTFLGRNMTILQEIFFATLNRKYLQKSNQNGIKTNIKRRKKKKIKWETF